MKSGIFKSEHEEAYHGEKEFISSSPLAYMQKTPAHFYESWTGSVETSAPMEKGTFIHKILLEQDISRYCARPLTENGELVRSNSPSYTNFLEANVGKIPLHPNLYNEAEAILSAACKSKIFMHYHNISDPEVSFYGVDKATGLPIKARTDLVCKEYDFILDVKSTRDISTFEKQIFTLGYDIRLAHYAKTVESVTGKLPVNLLFFAIESSAPWATKMYCLSPEDTDLAFEKWEQLMREVKVCIDDNNWPSYPEELYIPKRPAYLNTITELNFGEVAI